MSWAVTGSAIELLTQSLVPLEGELSTQRLGMPTLPSVMSRTYLSWSLAELGRFPEAAVRAEEGLRIAERVGEPFSRIAAYTALGSLRRSQGDLDEAIPILERAHALCQEANIVHVVAVRHVRTGLCLRSIPTVRGGTSAVGARHRGNHRLLRRLWIGWLGESYLLAGRMDDAARVGRQALELARNRKERGYEARALRLLGETAAQRDPQDAETAEVHYRQALTLAEELGMRPLVAHCHLGLGKLYRRTGDRAKAEEHLTTATTMYREMDMGFWLEKAEAELGGVER